MKKLTALLLSVLLLAGVLAGCGQNSTTAPSTGSGAGQQGSGDTPAPAPNEGGGEEAVFVGGWPYSTVPTGHFNMFVSGAIELKFYRELHQLPLATYVAATDEYEPMLATGWQVTGDGESFEVALREDATWLSGDAFTAEDVWTTFMLYRLMGNPVWSYIDAVEVVDAHNVAFTVATPTPLILRYVLRKPMVDYATYGEFAQKVQELLDKGLDESSSEWQELAGDFNIFRPEYVNATGPYYLDPANVTESSIELMKNESSFLAGTVNFDKVVVYNGDVADLTPLVLNGEVDFLTHQFPAASVETFEAMGYSTLQVAGVDGIAVYFNQAVEPLGSTAVRQAIAYVIDRQRVGELALPGVSQGTAYVSGLGDAMTEKWVDTTQLESYDTNLEKASGLLEAEGLTNKDGQWYLADGTQFTLSLQCPSSWSDGSTAASEIAQQLTAFGIKTTFDSIDATMRQSNIDEGSFELALSFFGTGQPHPMFAFETPLLLSNQNVAKGLGYNMVQQTERFGEVNLAEEIAASTAGWDLDAQRDAVEKIVGTVNETVPFLPLYTKYSKYVSSEGMRTDWGTNTTLYENSAGDDSFVIIKILNGELAPAG